MPITHASRANHANHTLLLNQIKFAFGFIVSEFLFPICVQKTISMNYFNENSRLVCNKQFTA